MFRQFKPSEELTKYLFCSTRASTLTEITDSVKKEPKTFVFGSFCMFFAHFRGQFQGLQTYVDLVDFIADFWRFFEKSRFELTTYRF